MICNFFLQYTFTIQQTSRENAQNYLVDRSCCHDLTPNSCNYMYCNFWPFTCKANYPHRPIIAYGEKKSTDYLHWWITRMLCYSTFWWQKHDIKLIHFGLLKVVCLTFENLKASLLSLKVKEIQMCAQFCVNISMYFIDKIIQ